MSVHIRHRPLRGLLLLLSANMLLDALEVSTFVVAMPAISSEFGIGPAAASWFVTGFAVGFGGSIILGRRLTGRLGRRRVFLGALLVFALASIVGGLAVDEMMLAATRVVKGICVALTAPTGLAIIAATFPEGPPRRRAIAVYSGFGASGFSVGLLLSGALTLVDWRWTVLFSGPVALVLFAYALRSVPSDGAPDRPRPTAAARGRGSAARDRAAVAGDPPAAERTRTYLTAGPLLRAAGGAAVLNGTYWSFLFLVTFQVQWDRGWSPLLAGLALLPTSVPLAVSAGHAGRLVSRFGPGTLILAGGVTALAGYAWYLGGGLSRGYPTGLLPAVLLVGAAFVLSFSALHTLALVGVPTGVQGAVTGVYQTSVQIGGAVTLGLVAYAAGDDQRAGAVLVTAVAAAGVVLAAAGLGSDRRRSRGGQAARR